MKIFLFFILILALSCNSQHKTQSRKVIGTWKSLNRDSYPDIVVIDSFRFNILLADSSETPVSIGFKYKLKGRRFYIYTYAFLASKNKILTLTNDSFVYVRPKDLDTFRYVRMN